MLRPVSHVCLKLDFSASIQTPSMIKKKQFCYHSVSLNINYLGNFACVLPHEDFSKGKNELTVTIISMVYMWTVLGIEIV